MIKTRYILILLTLLLLSLVASGCRGTGMVPSGWPGITVDGKNIYVAYNQFVYSVQASTGAQTERIPEKAINANTTFFHAPVMLDESNLLVGSYKNYIYIFDTQLNTATPFFKEAKSRWVAAPIVTEEAVYAANADGRVYALDLQGQLLWEPFETGAAIWANPLLVEDTLYVVSMDHFLYALNSRTGSLLWVTDLGGVSVTSPVADETGTLYVGTFGNQVLAIDGQKGTILWTVQTSDWVWATPTIGAEGVLYVTDLSGKVYAINTEDQSVIWQTQTDGPISGSVLVYQDNLYFATRTGTFYSLDLQGDPRWQVSIEEGSLDGTPVVAGEDLILVSAVGAEGIVYAYNTNGLLQWQYQPE